MAITFHPTVDSDWKLSSVIDGSGNSSITGTLPSAVVDGNLLIAVCTSYANVNPSTITLPDGWSSLLDSSALNGTFAASTHIGYKIASSEPASYDWEVQAAAGDDMVAICRVSGHYAGSPFSGTAAESQQSTTSPVSPTMTTAHANALAVAVACRKNASGWSGDDVIYPSGWTLIFGRRSIASSSGVAIAIAVKSIVSPGATGNATWTNWFSSSNYSYGATFAIRSADAITGPTLSISEHLSVGSF